MTGPRRPQRDAVETTVDADVRRTWKFATMIIGEENPPPGPWDDEPDKVSWVDCLTDLDCLMLRNHFGGWCGYVGVPRSHPFHDVRFTDCRWCGAACDDGLAVRHESPVSAVDVHGGLTFSARCSPGEPVDGVCHIPQPGRETEPWWLGFDCGHIGDAQPLEFFFESSRSGFFAPIRGVYRTEQYVRAEVSALAMQLVAVR